MTLYANFPLRGHFLCGVRPSFKLNLKLGLTPRPRQGPGPKAPKAPAKAPQGPAKAPARPRTPRPRTPWVHIRTTNPIESVFSTVRLRHDKTKGNGSRSACLTMVFKLMETASKGWRSLNGKPLLAEVVKGTVFIDGIKEKPAA